jgi:hypothetical protein
MTEIEKMEICKVCGYYATANIDTRTCFRCQQKIEDVRESGEDYTDCFDEDIFIR